MKFIIALLLTFNIYAVDFPTYSFMNMSLEFVEKEGSGEINGQEFYVFKEGDDFIFTSDEVEEDIVWENVPSFLSSLRNFQMEETHLVSEPRSITGKITYLNGYNDESTLEIDNAYLKCTSQGDYDDLETQYLKACTTNAKLVWKLIRTETTAAEKEMAFKVLQFGNVFRSNKSRNDSLAIKDLVFDIQNGALKGQVKIDLDGSFKKLTIDGNTNYDVNNEKLYLKVNRVKFGIFNVTNMLFNELNKLDQEGVEVSKPYIILDLSNDE